MADYTGSKQNEKSAFPIDAVDSQEWSRLEPVLTPRQLQHRFLFGIPLVSASVDPVTKRVMVMNQEDLKDHIIRAVGDLEADANHSIDIFPVKRSERKQFDRNELEAWGHFRVNHAPIISVDKLSIASGQGLDLYTLPNDWIDTAYFNKGLIYFTPLLPASTVGLSQSVMNSNGAGVFLRYALSMGWHPSLWKIEYTSGFKDALVPRIVNELIGCYAAIDILGLLGATNRSNTHSLGIDGMSQSVSTPGPEVYNVRIGVLDDKRKRLLNKLRALYGRKIAMSNI